MDQLHVINCVITLLEVIIVAVRLDMNWTLMK